MKMNRNYQNNMLKLEKEKGFMIHQMFTNIIHVKTHIFNELSYVIK